MTLWPRTLLARLLIIVLLGLLLANALSLTLVMVERMHSARTVMLVKRRFQFNIRSSLRQCRGLFPTFRPI